MSTYSFMKVFTSGLLEGLRIVENMQFEDYEHFANWAKGINAKHNVNRDNKGVNGFWHNYYVLDACGWPIQ